MKFFGYPLKKPSAMDIGIATFIGGATWSVLMFAGLSKYGSYVSGLFLCSFLIGNLSSEFGIRADDFPKGSLLVIVFSSVVFFVYSAVYDFFV